MLAVLTPSDSVIGSQGRRMCLINRSFANFCDAKENRMAFFLSPRAPGRDFQLHGEVPQDTPVL
jgi:hypothetical protein